MASCSTPTLTALEFFSGIGGLHYGLAGTNVPHKVLRAYDVDDSASLTYRSNFACTPCSKANIVSIKPAELEALGADIWLLSPPCQPYTRQGLQLGADDKRSNAMHHLIELLESGAEALLPQFLLLENVVGFESSSMRAKLHAVLTQRGFATREVWASPAHFGIPNQRTRYFLLASRHAAGLPPPPPPIAALVLEPAALADAHARGEPMPPPSGEVGAGVQAACAPLSQYLLPAESEDAAACALSEAVLERYGAAMDLVARHSRRSCCFTKNYSRYVKGTGSVLCEGAASGPDAPSLHRGAEEKTLEDLRPLRPRYFAPREVARLHGFPEEMRFPPAVSRKKQFELLGNSLSVPVVRELLRHLLHNCLPAEGGEAEARAAEARAPSEPASHHHATPTTPTSNVQFERAKAVGNS